ncbi:MAG: polysaccharide deacetylase family protein [Firmicutes bacterium]|nr:polysaccharide deacetylase family protein [Bacillota bacterium]
MERDRGQKRGKRWLPICLIMIGTIALFLGAGQMTVRQDKKQFIPIEKNQHPPQAGTEENTGPQPVLGVETSIVHIGEGGEKDHVDQGKAGREATGSIAEKIPVLMYHHMLRDEENKLFKENGAVIGVDKFEEQMKFLHEQGFHTITLAEMEKFLDKEITLPEKSLLITFDDGYLSNYIYAYPILKKYGLKAAVFMITAEVAGTPQPFDPDALTRFSWEEMEKSKDVFEFESHTHAMHSKADGVAYLLCKSDQKIKEDLAVSKQLLSSKYFAYPYGAYNAATIDILKDLGFKMAFTTKEGSVAQDSNPYELKRYAIWPNTTLKKFKKIVGVAK